MKLILISLFVIALTHQTVGVFWNDLRIKYSLNAFEAFHRVERTLDAALQNKFELASEACVSETDSGSFFGIRAKSQVDPLLSLLYDSNGIIAGVQARLAHDELVTPLNRFRYNKVAMFQNITENERQYFVLTAYFIPPDTICTSNRTEDSLTTEGTGTGLWLQHGPNPSDSVEISKTRSDAIEAGWTKNNCWPGMGYHNFYQVEHMADNDCLEDEAAFLLYNKKDEMLGFGFSAHGRVNTTQWIEYRQNIVSQIILEPVPQCILDENTLVGTTAMHVFFVDQPWLLNCL